MFRKNSSIKRGGRQYVNELFAVFGSAPVVGVGPLCAYGGAQEGMARRGGAKRGSRGGWPACGNIYCWAAGIMMAVSCDGAAVSSSGE